jgi:hypothetical protein
MESNRIKQAMQYGLYLGIYISLAFLIEAADNKFIAFFSFFISLGIPVVFYYIIRHYRDTHSEGFITFASAWSFGCNVYFFAGMIVELVKFVYCRFINQEYLPKMAAAIKTMYAQFHLFQDKLSTVDMLMQPHYFVLSNFFASFIVGGCMLSLIIAGLVQRKNNSL